MHFGLRCDKINKIFYLGVRRFKLSASGWRKLEKLVVKTAVKTVLIILGILVAVFAVFNFAFPQHMATVTESMGNYSIAVKYAWLRYTYTGDGEDLSRCFDDSVLLGNDKYILQYGEELTNLNEFERICEKKNQRMGAGYDYRHYVLGKMAVANYNTGKKQEAVELAAEANGTESFAYGNALMSLSAVARSEKDAEVSSAIITKLENIHPAIDKEINYLKEVTNSLRSVVASYGG